MALAPASDSSLCDRPTLSLFIRLPIPPLVCLRKQPHPPISMCPLTLFIVPPFCCSSHARATHVVRHIMPLFPGYAGPALPFSNKLCVEASQHLILLLEQDTHQRLPQSFPRYLRYTQLLHCFPKARSEMDIVPNIRNGHCS